MKFPQFVYASHGFDYFFEEICVDVAIFSIAEVFLSFSNLSLKCSALCFGRLCLAELNYLESLSC